MGSRSQRQPSSSNGSPGVCGRSRSAQAYSVAGYNRSMPIENQISAVRRAIASSSCCCFDRTMSRADGLRALSIAACLLVGAWWRCDAWPGDERVIVAPPRLSIAATLSPPSSGERAMLGRIVHLRNLFAPDVHIRFGRRTSCLATRCSRSCHAGNLRRLGTSTSSMCPSRMEDESTREWPHRVDLESRRANRRPDLDAREATLAMRKLDGRVGGREASRVRRRCSGPERSSTIRLGGRRMSRYRTSPPDLIAFIATS